MDYKLLIILLLVLFLVIMIYREIIASKNNLTDDTSDIFHNIKKENLKMITNLQKNMIECVKQIKNVGTNNLHQLKKITELNNEPLITKISNHFSETEDSEIATDINCSDVKNNKIINNNDNQVWSKNFLNNEQYYMSDDTGSRNKTFKNSHVRNFISENTDKSPNIDDNVEHINIHDNVDYINNLNLKQKINFNSEQTNNVEMFDMDIPIYVSNNNDSINYTDDESYESYTDDYSNEIEYNNSLSKIKDVINNSHDNNENIINNANNNDIIDSKTKENIINNANNDIIYSKSNENIINDANNDIIYSKSNENIINDANNDIIDSKSNENIINDANNNIINNANDDIIDSKSNENIINDANNNIINNTNDDIIDSKSNDIIENEENNSSLIESKTINKNNKTNDILEKKSLDLVKINEDIEKNNNEYIKQIQNEINDDRKYKMGDLRNISKKLGLTLSYKNEKTGRTVIYKKNDLYNNIKKYINKKI